MSPTTGLARGPLKPRCNPSGPTLTTTGSAAQRQPASLSTVLSTAHQPHTTSQCARGHEVKAGHELGGQPQNQVAHLTHVLLPPQPRVRLGSGRTGEGRHWFTRPKWSACCRQAVCPIDMLAATLTTAYSCTRPQLAAAAHLPRGLPKLRMHLQQLLSRPLLVEPAADHLSQPGGLLQQLVLR